MRYLKNVVIIVTIIVTFILGIIAKKNHYIKNNLIPLQNILIGLIVSIIYYIYTKDFSYAILVSGLLAGGTYDIIHNIEKICQNMKNKDDCNMIKDAITIVYYMIKVLWK